MQQQFERSEVDRDISLFELAPYATDWRKSRGRQVQEPSAMDRSPFQRDRDRIIHSDAFRRLQYKTQVFNNILEGDYRTRLTHSLEVAQLARTICRTLRLDEDLGETIALSHDLGHPAFGHAGEDALAESMEPYGGFRHNDQTMRIVRLLECRYGAFDGLNLTWESLEGIAKHNGPIPKEEMEGVEYLYEDLEPQGMCGMEAQVAAMADDLAYNHHDIDDSMALGIFTVNDIMHIPAFKRAYNQVTGMYPKLDGHRLIKEVVRSMVKAQVKDLIATTRRNIKKANPQSAEDVRALDYPLVAFSKKVEAENRLLKEFMREKVYKHVKNNRSTFKAYKIVQDLFDAFMKHRRMLPEDVQRFLPEDKSDLNAKARVMADHIASLTDRSIFLEHERLFGTLHR